jgi:hypothetical protein
LGETLELRALLFKDTLGFVYRISCLSPYLSFDTRKLLILPHAVP